ncbi:MAG: hypothetical protein AAGH15_23745, partial [Myxococcota bacterium]
MRTPLLALVALGLACGGKTGLEVGAAPPREDAGGSMDLGVDFGDLGPLPTFDCFWLWGEDLTLARAPELSLGPAAVAADEFVALVTVREGRVTTGILASTTPTPTRLGELEGAVVGDRAYGLSTGFMMAADEGPSCTFLGWSTRGEALGFASLGTGPCLFGEPRGDLAAFAQRDGDPAFLLALDARGSLGVRTTYRLATAPGRVLEFLAPASDEGAEAFAVED